MVWEKHVGVFIVRSYKMISGFLRFNKEGRELFCVPTLPTIVLSAFLAEIFSAFPVRHLRG